jgi:MFS family permease
VAGAENEQSRAGDRTPAYAYYALAVLTASSFLNFLDRQILSILAHSLKPDLGLTDAQLGFLLGTAFAVFYAVVGIAIGRVADAVPRTRLMGAGVAIWSATTALGAAATDFAGLAASRIGVGIGQASANPCSHSLISQYFPARRRAAALSVYLAGIFVGSASALLIGGVILQNWGQLCTRVPIGGACGLAGWKAALLIVGLPGLPIAVLVAMLREPPRPPRPHVPLHRLLLTEFGAAVPPFTLFALYAAGGARALRGNLVLGAATTAAGALLAYLTGDVAQWAAVALGVYSVCSWASILRLRDPATHRLTFGSATYNLAAASCALTACISGAAIAWAAPFAIRELGMAPAAAGVTLGLASAAAGGVAVLLGGWLADSWKLRDPRAPIWIGVIALAGIVASVAWMLAARSPASYIAAFFLLGVASPLWSPAFAALVQDLALPRMRATAAAAFALIGTVVGSAAGPYWAGKVSTLTGSLATGLLSVLALAPVALVALLLTARRLARESPADRLARAEAAEAASAV